MPETQENYSRYWELETIIKKNHRIRQIREKLMKERNNRRNHVKI